jgi:predicted porin
MNKKVMALAVAGAFAAPAAALAQASNVQIFGTVYVEYAYAKQGHSANAAGVQNGELVNIDFLQTPGSEIGFKGEEALGGGTSAWFQCTSTLDVRGSAPQGFCGRNSALGVKGGFGNFFAGNWDMPTKRTAGAVRILSDTGVFGTGFLLFNNSSTFNDNNSPASFSASSEQFDLLRHAGIRWLPGLRRHEHAFHRDRTHRRDLGCKASRLFVGWQLHQRSFDSHGGL